MHYKMRFIKASVNMEGRRESEVDQGGEYTCLWHLWVLLCHQVHNDSHRTCS